MLRRALPAVGGLSVTGQSAAFHPQSRAASSRPRGSPKPAEENEMARARQWLEDLSPETIPEGISKGTTLCDGFGKISKYQLRTPLSELFRLVPRPMHEAIRNHRYCSSSSDHLVITSTDSSKQSSKKKECSRKLYFMLREIGEVAVAPERAVSDDSKSIPRSATEIPWSKYKHLSDLEVHQLKQSERAAKKKEKHEECMKREKERAADLRQKALDGRPGRHGKK